MRLTVLGGCGAWPAAGQACSGYLVEHDGFRLLIDPGYATLPRLLQSIDADDVDAVWARIRGAEYHLEVDRASDRGLFTDGVVKVEVRHSERRPLSATARPEAPEGHTLDFSAYLNMALAVDGVLDPRRANPVNAPYLAG